MGLTERHWFEDEEPELTDRQLEDIVYENKKAYDSGYLKGFHDAKTLYPQIVRCKDCKHGKPGACGDDVDCDGVWHDDNWFCADGERREYVKPPTKSATDWDGVECE